MSLQSYIADYWPVMHTTALSVVRVGMDIFRRYRGKTFTFLVGMLPCKRGLRKAVDGGGVGVVAPYSK